VGHSIREINGPKAANERRHAMTQRKPGNSRLVFDKNTQTIKTELRTQFKDTAPLLRAINEEVFNVLAENGIAPKECDLMVTLGLRLSNLFANTELNGGTPAVQRALTKFYAKVSHHADDEVRILRDACKSAHTELVYLAEQVKARKGGSVMRAIAKCETALGKF
jgi:hypothetical protein